MKDVAIYTFHHFIDGVKFGGHIPAKDWDHARVLVSTFGGEVDGQLLDKQAVEALIKGDDDVDEVSESERLSQLG